MGVISRLFGAGKRKRKRQRQPRPSAPTTKATQAATAAQPAVMKPVETDPYTLDLQAFGFETGTFHSPPFQMDLKSTQFVLRGRAYPLIAYVDPPQVIIDCGGNAGATACHLAKAYPAARILSFEPGRKVFEFFRRNTAQFPNVTGFNFGLSDRDGTAVLQGGLESTVTQSLFPNSYTDVSAESVELRESESVLRANRVERIDILKLDTQGAEVPILRSLARYIPDISIIYAEYHSEDDRLAIDRLLSPTHIVVSGRIEIPHIGELCYVNKARYWEKGNLGHYRIGSR